MKMLLKTAVVGAALALICTAAQAQLSNQGILDTVVTEVASRAALWQTVIMNAALFLFWSLGAMSMVWTFGMMLLRGASLGEFFAEFIRFTATFGLFLWLLRNGPNFANSIIQSLAKMAEQASGTSSITPSGIIDVGFLIWKQALSNLSVLSPVDSIVGGALSMGIMILLALVAINMLLMLVSAWLLAYAGIFFLGFGGSRWTSDIAINYYKTVLGMGAQIMTMILLVGIGNDLLSTFYAKMNKGMLNFEELGVMLVFCLALLLLVSRVPSLVAGVISGGSVGSAAGIGGFGAGSALGVASVAAGAASMVGAAAMSAATNVAGGGQALMAAFSKASENQSSSNDVMAAFSGGGGGEISGAGSGGGAASSGKTPFADAAGFGGGPGGASAVGAGGDGASNETSGLAPASAGGGDGSANDQTANTPPSGSSKDQASSPAPGQQGPGLLASAASALGTAGRIAADTGANLARGTAAVAKEKAREVRDSLSTRIGESAGGRIAASIRHGAPEILGVSSVSDAPVEDADGEVALFVNRQRPE